MQRLDGVKNCNDPLLHDNSKTNTQKTLFYFISNPSICLFIKILVNFSRLKSQKPNSKLQDETTYMKRET